MRPWHARAVPAISRLLRVVALHVFAMALPACLAIPTVAFFQPAVTGAEGAARIERSEEAMGSWFAVVLHGPSRDELLAAADAAFQEVHRLDHLLSNYRPTSEWSRVNRQAASQPVRVSPELFALLEQCLEYSRQSEGAFDVTVGPLIKAWGFYGAEGSIPSGARLADALARVGYRHVSLDRTTGSVRFLRGGVELDPGGIGKGYAVDRMVSVLQARGVRTALVSAAGSSIYGLGSPPGETKGWRVSIGAPGSSSRPHARGGDPPAVGEVRLKDEAVSTSGSDEKFFRAAGRTFSHIIDPRTGHPAHGVSSVSVVSARAIDGEAWTKPYFVNGRAWTIANRRPGHRVHLCNDAPVPECAWIE